MSDNIEQYENMINDLSQSLAENFLQTVQILSRVATSTEKYYEGSHSRFIAEKSVLIAREFGMNEDDIMEFKIACLLHDIGKIGFPETLLYKNPNELSQQEYSSYILHPEIGMNLLKPYSAFDGIGEIIYQHHEKNDGSGYPRHLQKDNIHPGAKIMIVVDYFHNAVYKKQKNRTETSQTNSQFNTPASYLDLTKDRYNSTMNFLHKKKGILFEKKVVEFFTEVMEFERKMMGHRSLLRIPVNNLEPGMILAENYFTSFGMLVAAKGETITKESISALGRFAENGELPYKILVIK